MPRLPHLLSLTLASALLLSPSTAAANPGGSIALEVVGWDPVDRRIFVAEHAQEAGQWLPPRLGVFLLDAEDPSLLVTLHDPADLESLPLSGSFLIDAAGDPHHLGAGAHPLQQVPGRAPAAALPGYGPRFGHSACTMTTASLSWRGGMPWGAVSPPQASLTLHRATPALRAPRLPPLACPSEVHRTSEPRALLARRGAWSRPGN